MFIINSLNNIHQYLNYKSCHPPHVKKAITYSQALRLKRICNSKEVYEFRVHKLKRFKVDERSSSSILRK